MINIIKLKRLELKPLFCIIYVRYYEKTSVIDFTDVFISLSLIIS